MTNSPRLLPDSYRLPILYQRLLVARLLDGSLILEEDGYGIPQLELNPALHRPTTIQDD